MPRSIWKGAISFGLVTIPVKLFSATEEKDISFRQVHPEDGGRIKYKRTCEICGKEIPFAEIAKGYELPDGRMVILEKEDFDNLPLATTKAVEVVQFVAEDEIDPTYFNKTYFLQADGPGVKPYVLLRDALLKSGQSAVVKVALRSREALALIRPKDGVLVMHTMLWPDELRDGSFAAPPDNVVGVRRGGHHGPVLHQCAGRRLPARGLHRLLPGGAGDGGAEQGRRGFRWPRRPKRPRRPRSSIWCRSAGLGRGGQEAPRGCRARQGDVSRRSNRPGGSPPRAGSVALLRHFRQFAAATDLCGLLAAAARTYGRKMVVTCPRAGPTPPRD